MFEGKRGEKGDAKLFCRRQRGALGSATNNREQRTRLQCDIDATDRRIDQLVYELYGLTGIRGVA